VALGADLRLGRSLWRQEAHILLQCLALGETGAVSHRREAQGGRGRPCLRLHGAGGAGWGLHRLPMVRSAAGPSAHIEILVLLV
jgi:hypothetical protein